MKPQRNYRTKTHLRKSTSSLVPWPLVTAFLASYGQGYDILNHPTATRLSVCVLDLTIKGCQYLNENPDIILQLPLCVSMSAVIATSLSEQWWQLNWQNTRKLKNHYIHGRYGKNFFRGRYPTPMNYYGESAIASWSFEAPEDHLTRTNLTVNYRISSALLSGCPYHPPKKTASWRALHADSYQ